MSEAEGERQVPFYCPYCGDQDLRPAAAIGGAWECASCARGFELRFTGIVRTRQATP
jgi:ribosomal protein L37AE/L43A